MDILNVTVNSTITNQNIINLNSHIEFIKNGSINISLNLANQIFSVIRK